VRQSLHAAGIGEEDGTGARDLAAANAVSAAIKFARRRGLGPFAERDVDPHGDPREREKALSAMIRAGHGFALAKAILALTPGAEVDEEQLAEAR
jgi:regulatory protein